MKRHLAGLVLSFGICAGVAHAQTLPFDMSTERNDKIDAAPGATPQPAVPAKPQIAPAPPPPVKGEQPQAQPAAGVFHRYILPDPQLTLSGETDRRSWIVTLTPEQAQSGADLQIGYQSSVVVAPELSSLRITINNSTVIEKPLASAEAVSDLHAKVPAGLLRAGPNLVSVSAVMRHRTDCTIGSTYELWAEIDPARSFLSFANADAANLRRVDDIGAIGADAQGQTRFTIIVPATDTGLASGPVIRLAEGLARMANMPNQSVQVVSEPVRNAGQGHLTIVLGTPAEITPILGTLPQGSSISSVATFVDDPNLGPSTLVISGPTWNVIANAVETIIHPVDRSVGTARVSLATSAWRAPDARLFTEAGRATLAELGSQTQEFSGRRFRTDFAVGIPSDFYAYDYGKATLLLDAAYSSEVLPGSHIDVYVNGNIAATVPITQSGGGILRHFPVNVTMRHFRPGPNVIALEAVLSTSADALCAPGATGLGGPRFAVFDTSEFRMPDFARIGRRPDLAGISGTGFPYSRSATPVPLLLERGSLPALSTAATLLARMSVAAGRLIPIDLTQTPAAAANGDAIFIGTIDSLQPQLLADLGIADHARTGWGKGSAGTREGAGQPDTSAVFDRWRQQVSSGGWRGSISALEDWLSRNFMVTPDALRLTPRKNPPFAPGNDVQFFMTQQTSPGGTGTWTTVTAPSDQALSDGMKAISAHESWSRIAGQVTTYGRTEPRIGTVQVGEFQFVATQPPTFTNYRLIVANWLSANALSYAAALTGFCILLGVATQALLSIFGRRS